MPHLPHLSLVCAFEWLSVTWIATVCITFLKLFFSFKFSWNDNSAGFVWHCDSEMMQKVAHSPGLITSFHMSYTLCVLTWMCDYVMSIVIESLQSHATPAIGGIERCGPALRGVDNFFSWSVCCLRIFFNFWVLLVRTSTCFKLWVCARKSCRKDTSNSEQSYSIVGFSSGVVFDWFVEMSGWFGKPAPSMEGESVEEVHTNCSVSAWYIVLSNRSLSLSEQIPCSSWRWEGTRGNFGGSCIC